MDLPPRPTPGPASGGRRALVAAALLAAAGCRAQLPAPLRPTATPRTPGPLDQAMADEHALVAWLERRLATGATTGLSAARRTALQGIVRAHREHATAIAGFLPAGPVATPSPSPSPSARPPVTAAELERALVVRETALADAQRARALAADDGAQALLLASASVFARLAPRLTAAPATGHTIPRPTTVGTREDALQVLLSRQRALLEGLEVGLGQLPAGSDQLDDGRAQMLAVQADLDRTEGWLVALGRPVPRAEPAYQMPGALTGSAIPRTWALLEQQLVPGWGRLLAASTGPQRGTALAGLLAQAQRVRALGLGTTGWPGWA